MNTKPVFKTKEGKEAILAIYDAVLAQWPVPKETLNVETRYGKTHVIACGDESNPPLVLIHGTAFNSLMWMGDIAEYAKHFRVFAVDVLGEPGKSDDVQYPLKGNVYQEWLDDVVSKLGLKKVSLVGLSLGGWMALNFAVHSPQKVEKLVLLCPTGIGPQKFLIVFKAILAGEKGLDKLNRLINGDQPVPEEVVNYSRLISKNFNVRGYIPVFTEHELKRLNMPLAVFAGEKDVLIDSLKTAERVTKLLPNARMNLIPGAPHALINQTGKIVSFLQQD